MKLTRLFSWYQKEIEKLWKKQKDTRKYNIYTEETIQDSILHKQILDKDPKSVSDFNTCWNEELVEFVIKAENLKNLYKKGYLKHITNQYGQKFPKNHVRQAAWHEYSHTLTLISCEDIPDDKIHTNNVPFFNFRHSYLDFLADYTLINSLRLEPTYYIRARLEAIKYMLLDSRLTEKPDTTTISKIDTEKTKYYNFFLVFNNTLIFYVIKNWRQLSQVFREANRILWLKFYYLLNYQFFKILKGKFNENAD